MGILEWLMSRGPSVADGDDVDTAIEHVVAVCDPRLRAARGYRGKLAPAVRQSLAYSRDAVAALPPSLDLAASRWAQDNALRAFFAVPGDLDRLLAQSEEPRRFFEANAACTAAWALLGMERREQNVFTHAEHGGVLQSDVARVTVGFSDHKLTSPSPDEAALRRALERRALGLLAAHALDRLAGRHDARTRLEQERAILGARLRLLAGASDLESEDDRPDADAVRARMESNERALAEHGGNVATLDGYLTVIAEALSHPEAHFGVHEETVLLDDMNMRVAPGVPGAREVRFVEARAADGRTRVLMPVRIARADVPARRNLIADADKYL